MLHCFSICIIVHCKGCTEFFFNNEFSIKTMVLLWMWKWVNQSIFCGSASPWLPLLKFCVLFLFFNVALKIDRSAFVKSSRSTWGWVLVRRLDAAQSRDQFSADFSTELSKCSIDNQVDSKPIEEWCREHEEDAGDSQGSPLTAGHRQIVPSLH